MGDSKSAGGGGGGGGIGGESLGVNGTVGASAAVTRSASRQEQINALSEQSKPLGPERHNAFKQSSMEHATPVNGRVVATTLEMKLFYGKSPNNFTARDGKMADKIGNKRTGTLRGERNYVKSAHQESAKIKDVKRLARIGNALEDMNAHGASHIFRTRGALLMSEK